MSKKPITDVAASVRQRLLNLANQAGGDPNLIWSRYAVERLLYRLGISEFSREFVLKGAALFAAWSNDPHRPTMDLDLLGHGEDSNERMADLFKRICNMEVEGDGLRFDAASIQVAPIREGQEYQGRRVVLMAYLGRMRIPVQVDIGFGNVVTPRAEWIEYPTLLDLPAPRIRACTQPTVIAEKFHAMVLLGIGNSRMKDFYDIHALATHFDFEGAILVQAVKATFKRRKTDVPAELPMALSETFGLDAMKNTQWNAFIRKGGLSQKAPSLMNVLSVLQQFLLPVMTAAAGTGPVPGYWKAGGGTWETA